MREIATQRAKQLQEEEEEWIREQKAKALTKLKDLNRRAQTMDGSAQKLETAPPSDPIQRDREESRIPGEPVMVASKSETQSSALVSNPNTQIREGSTIGVEEFTILFKDALLETSDNLPLQQDAHTAGATGGTAITRRASHGVQGRLDPHGRRFNNHDPDGWRKKPLAVESISEVSAANSEPSINVHVHDLLTSVEVAEKSGINLKGKDEGESFTPMFDASDCQAQRVKMREIAKQRAKQLQEEEEERIREQKAKALTKLKDLNRRAQTMDGSAQKLETAPPSGPIQRDREESRIPAEPVMVASKSETQNSALVANPNTQIREGSTIGVEEFTILFKDALLETSDNLPLQQDAHTAGATRGTAITRRASHGVQGRLDPHGRRFNNHDPDGWQKKPLAVESISEVSAANSEPSINVHGQDLLTSVEVAEKSGINLQGKDEGESLTPMFDASDCQAQRAKMREIVKQRAKQLQEEEEERIREQKAKALAKLEELYLHNKGSRYSERSQGNSRRGGGHFYGRQSGTVHAVASYD